MSSIVLHPMSLGWDVQWEKFSYDIQCGFGFYFFPLCERLLFHKPSQQFYRLEILISTCRIPQCKKDSKVLP